MDLLTWTRKGKDSNIYYIYTYIRYILIGMLPKSQKSGEFVGTFLLLLLLTTTVVIVFVCVCVYPCKQFVVVGTIRRTDSWNTIPTYLTLPYLTHLFHRTLTRSTGIHHRFIVWFLERTIILEDKKVPPRNKFQTCPRTHWNRLLFNPIQFSKYSRRALERHFHSGSGGCCGDCYYPKSQRPNQTKQNTSIFKEEVHFFTINNLPFLHQYQNQSIQDKEKKEEDQKNNNNNINIKTMTHHRMGFTPSSSTSSSSSSSTTTKPSAITTKKSPQRACLGGMVITPCEKCTIRTYVSLSSLSLSSSHPT